jgi:AcrR family transcriptional regulator
LGKVIRERDAEVAREAIMQAAEEMFAEHGYDGARIDTIAAKAGYNKSLIFHYFGDKDGLYVTVVMHMKERMVQEYMEPLRIFTQSSAEMTCDRLRIFIEMAVDSYLNWLTQNPNNMRILAWEAAEGWRHFNLIVSIPKSEQHKKCLGALTGYLEHAQEVGLVNKNISPRFITFTIGNLCTNHLLSMPRWKAVYGDEPLSTSLAFARQQIIELVLHGILEGSSHDPSK